MGQVTDGHKRAHPVEMRAIPVPTDQATYVITKINALLPDSGDLVCAAGGASL